MSGDSGGQRNTATEFSFFSQVGNIVSEGKTLLSALGSRDIDTEPESWERFVDHFLRFHVAALVRPGWIFNDNRMRIIASSGHLNLLHALLEVRDNSMAIWNWMEKTAGGKIGGHEILGVRLRPTMCTTYWHSLVDGLTALEAALAETGRSPEVPAEETGRKRHTKGPQATGPTAHAIHTTKGEPAKESSPIASSVETPQGAADYPTPDNYERDKWIFEQRTVGTTIPDIIEELGKNKHGWEPVYSPGSIREAAKRYGEHHDLPIPKGRPGRRRRE